MKLKRFQLILFFNILSPSSMLAQLPPSLIWQKSVGGSFFERMQSVRPTSDGGYIAVGYSDSNDGDVSGNHGGGDVWVIKLNSMGGLEWQKAYGGSGAEDGHDIQQTSDGGYIVAARTFNSNNGDVTGSHGNWDWWIIKLSGNGQIIWQKCLGGSKSEYAQSIQQTPDGGYIVAGSTSSEDGDVNGFHGNYDFWVVKLSTVGIIQWQKCLGGSSIEEGYSIQLASDGGYIVAGLSSSHDGDVTLSTPQSSAWVVKLSNFGVLQWNVSLGGIFDERANSVRQTIDGGYIVTGYTTSPNVSNYHDNHDVLLAKISSTGGIEWQKCIGGSNSEEAYGVVTTSSGDFIIAGYTYSNDGDVTSSPGNDFWVFRVNSAGVILWQKRLGGPPEAEGAYALRETLDGGLIVAGSVEANGGDITNFHGGYDGWIVKLGGIVTSVGSLNQSQILIEVSPNPSSGTIYVKVKNLRKVRIYSSEGKLLKTEEGNLGNEVTLHLFHFPKGAYVMEVADAKGRRGACTFLLK